MTETEVNKTHEVGMVTMKSMNLKKRKHDIIMNEPNIKKKRTKNIYWPFPLLFASARSYESRRIHADKRKNKEPYMRAMLYTQLKL